MLEGLKRQWRCQWDDTFVVSNSHNNQLRIAHLNDTFVFVVKVVQSNWIWWFVCIKCHFDGKTLGWGFSSPVYLHGNHFTILLNKRILRDRTMKMLSISLCFNSMTISHCYSHIYSLSLSLYRTLSIRPSVLMSRRWSRIQLNF